jgi:hypothetical protein
MPRVILALDQFLKIDSTGRFNESEYPPSRKVATQVHESGEADRKSHEAAFSRFHV